MNSRSLHLVNPRMTVRGRLAALLMTALALFGIGCSSTRQVAVDSPRTEMTVPQARKSIAESLNELQGVRNLRFTRRRMFFEQDYDVHGESRHYKYAVAFSDLKSLSLKVYSFGFCVRSDDRPVLSNQKGGSATFETEEAARRFVDGLFALRRAATAPDPEEADFAAFSAAAKTWQAAEPKPPMSDEARSCKALAEDMFKRKDFTAALEAYVEGLGKHPMWPEGHYNAALLAAEIEDYDTAARHMRRYLALAPDAKDASAAKDKYLLWQRKAKE